MSSTYFIIHPHSREQVHMGEGIKFFTAQELSNHIRLVNGQIFTQPNVDDYNRLPITSLTFNQPIDHCRDEILWIFLFDLYGSPFNYSILFKLFPQGLPFQLQIQSCQNPCCQTPINTHNSLLTSRVNNQQCCVNVIHNQSPLVINQKRQIQSLIKTATIRKYYLQLVDKI